MARVTKQQAQSLLYLDSSGESPVLLDGAGKPVTIEEARTRWDRGTIQDYNLSVRRLALLNWDYEALKAHYADGGRP